MDFEKIHQEVLQISRDDHSCTGGHKDALSAENFGQLASVFKKYWADVTKMHLERAIKFLDTYYEENKKEFQENDIYYNCDTDRGLALIYNAKGITVSGTADAQAYGESEVTARGNAKVYARDNVHIDQYDYSSSTLDGEASTDVHDRAETNARENNYVRAYNASDIIASGNTYVEAFGWKRIVLYGSASVVAPVNKQIFLRGQNKITIKPLEQ